MGKGKNYARLTVEPEFCLYIAENKKPPRNQIPGRLA
jgi:hypothetical protein